MPQMKRGQRRSAQQRRHAIMEAATALFFKQGYAATSVDEIVAQAGGSKRDIYHEFGNKEGLFSTLVSENAERVLAPLSIDMMEARRLDDILREFGTHLLTLLMSPLSIGLFRTSIAEAPRFPQLARAFYEKGPGSAVDRLTQVLEVAIARGEIHLPNCQKAAEHFIGMVRDNLYLRVCLGLQEPPSPQEIEVIIADIVSFFLKAARA